MAEHYADCIKINPAEEFAICEFVRLDPVAFLVQFARQDDVQYWWIFPVIHFNSKVA